jgi:type VI secretion system protein VasD
MGIKCLGFAELAGRVCGFAAAMCLFVSACAHASAAPPPPCTAPEQLRVALSATDRVNPDDKGAALATVVRLYQLKSVDKLQLASFDDFLDKDRAALGDDFVAMQELTVNPGDRLSPAVTRSPDAAYLVAVALFRQPTSLTWRAVKQLPAIDPQACHAKDPSAAGGLSAFALDENRIEVR